MNHKFTIDYTNSRVVAILLIIVLQLNVIGFCLGFIIGFYKCKNTMEDKYILIRKISLTEKTYE